MPIIYHKQLLQCFHAHLCRDFMKLDRFTSWNLRYCLYPLNLNHPNFNIVPYGKNQKNELLEMTKCNGAKFLPHNSISLTFWTIFFTENIRYPFNIFPVIGTWGTKYPKSRFISNSSHCSFTVLSKHITSTLTGVKDHVIKYSETTFRNSNVNYFYAPAIKWQGGI